MVKKIFKGIGVIIKTLIYFIGIVATYIMLIALLCGKGELKYKFPFTDEPKVWTWDNTGGNK